MNTRRRKARTRLFLATLAASVLLLGGLSRSEAQQSGVYDLSWHKHGGAGTKGSAGAFELNGTAAQLVASKPATAGNFSLASGYWPGVQNGVSNDVFKDGFE